MYERIRTARTSCGSKNEVELNVWLKNGNIPSLELIGRDEQVLLEQEFRALGRAMAAYERMVKFLGAEISPVKEE